jgi:hypothetical protein
VIAKLSELNVLKAAEDSTDVKDGVPAVLKDLVVAHVVVTHMQELVVMDMVGITVL